MENLKNSLFRKKEIEKILEKALKKEVIRDKELTLISKEKKKISLSIAVSLRRDTEGNFIGYFFAFSDITEIK